MNWLFRKLKLMPHQVVLLYGEKTRNEYVYPVKRKYIKKIAKHQSPIHRGKYKHSVDFLFTTKWCDYSVENVPIFAAADGVVVFVEESFKEGGNNKKYLDKGNLIIIKHNNSEYSLYEHIKHKGACIKKGEFVRGGQKIGYSGNTGFTLLSHLHFQVYVYVGKGVEDFNTLKIRWK